MMDERRFTEWCYKKYVEEKSTHSVVTLSYMKLVIRYLKCATIEEENAVLRDMDGSKKATFKYKVKEKKYSWMTLPSSSQINETLLTVPKKKGDGYLIVCPVEKFFSTLKSIHEGSGHSRKFTMWKKVSGTYAGLPRTVLEKFLKNCDICKFRAAKENEPEFRRLKATGVFERIQILSSSDKNYADVTVEDQVVERGGKAPKAAAKCKKGPVGNLAAQQAKLKKEGKGEQSVYYSHYDYSEDEGNLAAQQVKTKNGRKEEQSVYYGADYDYSEDEDQADFQVYELPSGRSEHCIPLNAKPILTVNLNSTHPSVRIKGTENNYNPVQCFDTNCRDTTPHMHCPFCVKTDCYTDPVILKAHYRVKHVDKGIDFAGLKVLRCCDRCDIVGVIKGEKKFKGAHWHCYKCKNGFNRRDEAIKHYKTHFRNPQTTFQIQIAQEVNQSVTQGFETDEASVSIPSEEFSVQSIHPVLTEAVTCMASAEDQSDKCPSPYGFIKQCKSHKHHFFDDFCITEAEKEKLVFGSSKRTIMVLNFSARMGAFSQTSNFPVVAKIDGNVSMPGVGAIETVGVSDTQTIMIIQDDHLQDTCVTQDISADEPFTKNSVLEDSMKQDHDQTIQNLCETIHKLQEHNAEKDKEIERLKKKVQDQDVEINQLKEREQELLLQLKSPDDKKLQELCEQLEAQHKEFIQQQLAQLRKAYFQSTNLQPKILIVNNSMNSQLDQQIGLDACTINTDSSGSISIDFNNPNTTANPDDQNVNASEERDLDIENDRNVISEKCGEKDFEMLPQEFTDSLDGERLQIEDDRVPVESHRQGPPVKKRKGK